MHLLKHMEIHHTEGSINVGKFKKIGQGQISGCNPECEKKNLCYKLNYFIERKGK